MYSLNHTTFCQVRFGMRFGHVFRRWPASASPLGAHPPVFDFVLQTSFNILVGIIPNHGARPVVHERDTTVAILVASRREASPVHARRGVRPSASFLIPTDRRATRRWELDPSHCILRIRFPCPNLCGLHSPKIGGPQVTRIAGWLPAGGSGSFSGRVDEAAGPGAGFRVGQAGSEKRIRRALTL